MRNKALTLLFLGILTVTATACSVKMHKKTGAIDSTEISSKDETVSEEELAERQLSNVDNSPVVDDMSADNGYITVYFSYGDDKADQYAEMVHEEVGGQIEALTPTEPYTATADDLLEVENTEKNSDARPSFEELTYNPEKYKTILVGYPIWDDDMPMILYTFFDTYDFSGKKIIPFCIETGSGFSDTDKRIAQLEPNATVVAGAATVSDQISEIAAPAIREWLRYAIASNGTEEEKTSAATTESSEAAATETETAEEAVTQ